MKLMFALCFLLSGSFLERPQNFESRYLTIYQNGNQEEMLTFLHTWKVEEPNSPEMYIAFSNFYFQNSREELIRVIEKPVEGQHLEQVYSSNNEAIGFIFKEYVFDDSIYSLALQTIVEGIKKNPKRLDMHLGKLFLEEQKGCLDCQRKELLNMIALHESDRDLWLWKNNQSLEDPDLYFKESIQEYINNMFDEDASNLVAMEAVAQAMAKIYPKDVNSYYNLGNCSYLRKDYDKALGLFKKAHKRDPKEVYVLYSIVNTYEELDTPELALPYLEMISEYGDEEAVGYAQNKMSEIKSSN